VVRVEDAVDRVTAEPVFARSSVPHYAGAAMDGIAVRAEDTRAASEATPVVFELGTPDETVRPFTWVDTGNALPPWASAVVMVEKVHAAEGQATVGRSRPDRIAVRASAPCGQHVRRVGEDVGASESLLPRGHRVRPYDVGALLAAGVGEIAVRPLPVVAIVPTGDELIEPGAPLAPGRIVEFNSRMIAALVRQWGGEPIRLAPVRDDLGAIRARLAEAISAADVVCVIAGSSAGEHDFTPAALSGFGEILAHGIDVMPGRPAILATIAPSQNDAAGSGRARVAIGVPGYPVSAVVVCRELLAPLLAHLAGAATPIAPSIRAVLPSLLASRPGQEELVRVALGEVAGRLIARPLARGAGAITTITRADGLVRVPADVDLLEPESEVDVELLRPLEDVLGTIVVAGNDPALALLEDHLRAVSPRFKLATSALGSFAGLQAIARGQAHVAAVSVLAPAGGPTDRSAFDGALGDTSVSIVHVASRELGWVVAPENPLRFSGVHDLTREEVRFLNRPPGSGTRAFLEALLARENVETSRVAGWERAETSSAAIAGAVRSGLADVGLATRACATMLGVDFVPVAREDLDLVLRGDFAESEAGRALVDAIRTEAFRSSVATLPGYDAERTGRAKSS